MVYTTGTVLLRITANGPVSMSKVYKITNKCLGNPVPITRTDNLSTLSMLVRRHTENTPTFRFTPNRCEECTCPRGGRFLIGPTDRDREISRCGRTPLSNCDLGNQFLKRITKGPLTIINHFREFKFHVIRQF